MSFAGANRPHGMRNGVRPDGTMSEITTICVDQTEFVVGKLKDRGTHQAFGVVTNAQDFMRLVQLELMARG